MLLLKTTTTPSTTEKEVVVQPGQKTKFTAGYYFHN